MIDSVTIRVASRADIPALEKLIERSAWGLGSRDYSSAETEAALSHVYGVDRELLDDGTYFVAEIEGELAGCGGWSRRRTLFGGDHASARPSESGTLDPATEPAKIRAFFVEPRFARRGIGGRLIAECESRARAEGFRSLELMATLTGEKLYRRFGYEEVERVSLTVGNGIALRFTRMKKSLL